MDRPELAATLKTWRERMSPEAVGLPRGSRRRTPGLRREEVAGLAGISPDYLTRLEQARGPHPSDQVLTALARALRLNDDERDQLFLLAGSSPPLAGHVVGAIRPSVLRLLDRLSDPAMLTDAKGEIIAWNPLAAALLGDFSATPPGRRNMPWYTFVVRTGNQMVRTPDELESAKAEAVANLRAAAARYPHDPGVRKLVADLRRASPEFAERWERRDVAIRRNERKRIAHPALGVVEVDCDVLHLPDSDQRLIVYTAEQGTSAAAALDLLRVVGTQDVTAEA